jgi:lipopolysaccharide/colanic/teichoic acid biosynthesis glycosyltransferase
MTVGTPGSGPQLTVGNDRRITRIGRILRRYKLDELPQLINVLKGDMSLVGPRPEVPSYVALYRADQRDIILSIRPGITDNASLEFRNESELLSAAADPEAYYRQTILPRKCALYVEYAQCNNPLGDIQIIARTISLLLGRT